MESACKKTASVCTSETARGTHVFAIEGYSLKNGMGVGKFLQSTTFTVGGYDWAIRVYPDGTVQHSEDSVVIYIMLVSQDVEEVRALFDLRIVDRPSGLLARPAHG